jgi:hypothetical protein
MLPVERSGFPIYVGSEGEEVNHVIDSPSIFRRVTAHDLQISRTVSCG